MLIKPRNEIIHKHVRNNNVLMNLHMRKKIILGTLLIGLILLGIYLNNLGQRPDRKYPSFPLHPEKKAETVHDSIPLQDVVLAGNNWDGVITIFDPNTFKIIKKVSAMPDREERFEEIYSRSCF